MNVELLQQIKTRILAEPDTFRMDEWNCGTAQCIAGWACTLSGREWVLINSAIPTLTLAGIETVNTDWQWPVIRDAAINHLDITNDAATRLFHDQNWPVELREEYEAAEDRAERARIAARRIEAFIAAEGNEDYDIEGEDDYDESDDRW